MRRLLAASLVVGFTVALPSVAFAQAALAGVVKDASGAVLPGVTVEASSPELIEKARVTTTDDIGLYRFSSLEPGDYSLEFTQTGFSKIEIRSLTLKARDRQNLRISLQIIAVSQSLDITGK